MWFNFRDKTYKIRTYATVGAGLINDIDDKLKDKGFVGFDFDLILPEVLRHHKDFSDPKNPQILRSKVTLTEEFWASLSDQELVVQESAPSIKEWKLEVKKWIEQQQKSNTYNIQEVTPAEVEAAQRKLLGAFYLDQPRTAQGFPPLPNGIDGADSMDLEFLGLRSKTSVVDEVVDLLDHQRSVVQVGLSATGKTGTLVSVASARFVLSICGTGTSVLQATPKFCRDINCSKMTIDLHQQLLHHVRSVTEEPDRSMQYFLIVGDRVWLEMAGRLLFSANLFHQYPNLTPEAFLREQVSSIGRNAINSAITMVQKEFRGRDALDLLLKELERIVLHSIKSRVTNQKALVWALDEAQLFIDVPNAESLWHLRPSILPGYESKPASKVLPDQKQWGFLSPFTETLTSHGVVFVIGTKLSLKDADQVISAIGREGNTVKVAQCSPCTDVWTLLSQFINLSEIDKEDPEVSRALEGCQGRHRIAAGIVCKIATNTIVHNISDKKEKLIKAAQLSRELSLASLTENVKTLLTSHPDIKPILLEALTNRWLFGTRFRILTTSTVDLVNAALCSIVIDPCSSLTSFEFGEEIVFDSIAQAFATEHIAKAITDLRSSLEKEPSKGNKLQSVVAVALLGFCGKTITDLPFVKEIKDQLPDWCYTTKLNFIEYGSASKWKLGIDCTGDVNFFEDPMSTRLLIPHNLTRPDGADFLVPPTHLLAFSAKIYSDELNKETTSADIMSTDHHKWCLSKLGDINANIKTQHDQLEEILCSVEGRLRIHVMIPNGSGAPKSHVEGNDVLVFINAANYTLLFCSDAVLPDFAEPMRNAAELVKQFLLMVKAENSEKAKQDQCAALSDGALQKQPPMKKAKAALTKKRHKAGNTSKDDSEDEMSKQPPNKK